MATIMVALSLCWPASALARDSGSTCQIIQREIGQYFVADETAAVFPAG